MCSYVYARAANVTSAGVASSKAHYVAREDQTSRAGAVYVFSRLATSTDNNDTSTSSVCTDEDDGDDGIYGDTRRRYYCPRGGARGEENCGWEESAKLTASDRRGGDLFGTCLSANHDTGVVVVGAPGASLTGLWREVRVVVLC